MGLLRNNSAEKINGAVSRLKTAPSLFLRSLTSIAMHTLAGGRTFSSDDFLDNFHTDARADSGCASMDHLLSLFQIAHATRSLDTHLAANCAAHQRYVGSGRSAFTETCRRLDEIGSGFFRDQAGADFFVIC